MLTPGTCYFETFLNYKYIFKKYVSARVVLNLMSTFLLFLSNFQAPSSLLEALEDHLSALENTKRPTGGNAAPKWVLVQSAFLNNLVFTLLGAHWHNSGKHFSLPLSAQAIMILYPPHRPASGVSTAISNYTAASQKGAAPGAGAAVSAEITEDERRCILDEEQRQLELMKVWWPFQKNSSF